MHRGRSIFVDSRLSREYLTCQLCKNIYQSPKLLPCFHSFCYSCLKALEPRNEPVLGCPTCQTKTGVLITDMDRLPANQIINRELIKYKLGMVKSKAKSMQCENCEARPLSAICLSCSQILCFLCVKKHQDTDLHTVLSVEQAKKYDYSELITQEMLCQAHDLEDLKYFCNNCECAVCRVCVMAEHKSHEYTYLNGTTRLTESIEKLTQGARVTESKMAKLEVAMSESNMQVKRLEERATVVKNDIKRTFREYESLMKAKEKELLEEVDRLTEAELSKSDGPTALGLELERRKAWNQYANLLLNHGEANETVAMTSMLMNRFRAFSVENQSIETSNYKDIEYFAYHHLFSDALSVLGFVTNDPLQKLKEKQHNFKMLTASSLTKRTKDSSSDMGYRGFRDKSDKENLMLDPGSRTRLIRQFGGTGKQFGRMHDPRGIISTKDHEFYVTDSKNHRIQVFDNNGKAKSEFGEQGIYDGQFQIPYGIACNPNGRLFVTDHENHRIQVFSSERKFISAFGSRGSLEGQFNNPSGIITDSRDNIIVVDRGNNRIQVFDMNGKFISKHGVLGGEKEEFNLPCGITIDLKGRWIISDLGNDRIQVFDSDGRWLHTFGAPGRRNSEFNWPTGLAVDARNNIYICDSHNDRIQVFSEDVKFLGRIGSTGNSAGCFNKPEDILVTQDDLLIVVDWGNDRVQVLGQ